jgi:RimJ/RimL family protein N-acetyltransferase
MKPFTLSAGGLLLDAPRPADEEVVFRYCQDPIFERFMTLPWPYRRSDAEYFVREFVPNGWANGSELTWALRGEDGEFRGVIGLRLPKADLGFWLGAPYRGKGYMPTAVRLVTEWVFGYGECDRVGWECVAGNTSSMAVARKTGFTFTGTAPSTMAFRNGSHPLSWHGVLRRDDSPEPKPGWPAID